jgi:serine/threonine protein kinase
MGAGVETTAAADRVSLVTMLGLPCRRVALPVARASLRETMMLEPSLNGAGSGTEARLAGVLEAYLAALEAGTAPDREELFARHPELADDLDACLTSLAFIRRADTRAGADPRDPAIRTLGDFRIICEVGRGGMGIVYEAEQLSLARRVALKILPFAAIMDPRQLQRFQNEARAAASLQHPHIVPVHAVGYERGVHYYAMQFIDGQSLASLIEQQRAEDSNPATAEPPTDCKAGTANATVPVAAARTERAPRDTAYFRRMAQWGIQAAEALEHAHSVGIVHRDIKPANLMIDLQGTLWVTDFGLARTASDAGVTMTGDVLGTLRYMSPEQALAKHGLVDHRTDVYSLGVTLYELLTATPAVGGEDREQILNAITLEEPRAPRKLDAAIPQDLETIVLKAMGREPVERYDTAKELADDLRRFLENRPVIARRPTSWQRAGKWARRQKALVRAVSAGLAIAVVALATSTFLSWRAYQAEAEQRQLAEANYLEAKEQRRQARQAVDKMYLEVADKWLARQPQLAELQKQFLQEVLSYYRKFAEERGEDEESRFEQAEAYLRVGRLLLFSLSQGQEAQAPLVQANALLEELAQQFPDKGIYTARLAHAQNMVAFSGVGDKKQELERAVSLTEGLVGRYPEEPQYRYELGLRLANLAEHVTGAGKLEDGERLCRRAAALMEELIRSPSPRPEYYRVLGGASNNLADNLRQAGNWLEAAENYRKAIAAYQRLTPDSSGLPEYQHDLDPFHWHNWGNSYGNLGATLGQLKRFEEAEDAFAKAVRIHDQLVKDFPTAVAYQIALFRDYRDKGTMFWIRGQSREADRAYAQALEFGERIAAAISLEEMGYEFPLFLVTCPDPKWRNARRTREWASKATVRSPLSPQAWNTLGIAHYRLGEYALAIPALERAISLRSGEHVADQFFVAMAYWRHQDERQARRWYEKAITWMDRNRLQDAELVRYRDEASELLGLKGRAVRDTEVTPAKDK